MLPVRVHTVEVARLEGSAPAELARALTRAFAGRPRAVVLDLSRVVYVDAFGAAVIATALRRAPPGSILVLAGLGPELRSDSHLARLHCLFDVYVDAAAALRALETPASLWAHG